MSDKFPRPELLLHPNIPKPLHGLNPRTLLGKEWWDIERQKAYATHDYRCWACGVPKSEALYHRWLEAHEIYEYDYGKGRAVMVEIVALCHACHNYIHDGRMAMLVDSGEMDELKEDAILKHGKAVLKAAGFERYKPSSPKECAKWEDWRLVLQGVEYEPLFKSYEDWSAHYRREASL